MRFDNSTHPFTCLECKERVKYLGILLDSNLSWRFHIEYIALKISQIIGVIARLRHFVPLWTLLKNNRHGSLIFPYLSYGLAAWGQAAKTHLKKPILLQKRVLRLMYFSEPRAHAMSLLISLNMLSVETVSSLMYDVSHLPVPCNVSDLFTKINKMHTWLHLKM